MRVGFVDGQIAINPTESDLAGSTLDMVVAGTSDAIMMVEGESDQVSEETIVAGIERAHEEIRRIVDLQLDLQRQAGKENGSSSRQRQTKRSNREFGTSLAIVCAPRSTTQTRCCASKARQTCGRSCSPTWRPLAMKKCPSGLDRRSWMRSKRSEGGSAAQYSRGRHATRRPPYLTRFGRSGSKLAIFHAPMARRSSPAVRPRSSPR